MAKVRREEEEEEHKAGESGVFEAVEFFCAPHRLPSLTLHLKLLKVLTLTS